jgi:hypothetical protein
MLDCADKQKFEHCAGKMIQVDASSIASAVVVQAFRGRRTLP